MKRRNFFKMAGTTLMLPKIASASSISDNPRLLIIYNQGGWDVSMLFDPKFHSNQIQTASDGESKTIGGLTFVDSPERPNVRNFMNQYANMTAIINGLGIGSISHRKCERLLFTGSRLDAAPDFGSIIAHHHSDVPLPYSILSGPRMTGDLGLNVSRVDQTFIDLLQQNTQIDYTRVYAHIQQYQNAQSQNIEDVSRHQEYWQALERRNFLKNQIDIFPTTISSDPIDQMRLSVKLLANDISRVSMVEIPPPPFHQWDSHSGNDALQSGCFEYLFQNLNHLCEQLHQTLDNQGNPLMDSTTIMVMSEMGRTPVYNMNEGKDHWPFTSMLLFGNRIRGGQVFGATDDKITPKKINFQDGQASNNGQLLQSENLLAGLLSSFDIDPLQYFGGEAFTAPFL